MDSYAARLIFAAVMIGTAAVSAALFSSAQERTDGRSEPAMVAWAETAPETQKATDSAASYYVVLRGEQLSQGEIVSIYDSTGSLVQELQADAEGELLAGPLPCGDYQTWTQQLGGVQFRLLDNAAVETMCGNGWSDGEVLHLTSGVTASMEVLCQVSSAPDTATIVTLGLRNAGGQTVEQSIYIAPEATDAYGQCTKVCLFYGLAPGTYELLVDGISRQSVVILPPPEENILTLQIPIG